MSVHFGRVRRCGRNQARCILLPPSRDSSRSHVGDHDADTATGGCRAVGWSITQEGSPCCRCPDFFSSLSSGNAMMSKTDTTMTEEQGNVQQDLELSRTETGVSEKVQNTMGTTRRRLVMLSLCLAQFLAAIDITIVATALPTIASSLHATSAQYTWVGSAYNLASTASTPLWAKLSDVVGRKTALLAANTLFLAGSLLAALANSILILIGGRCLQGIGGGGLMILNTIIISDIFPLEDRAKYYGLSAIVWAIASALGPMLGGVFTSTIGWRWCFYINLPLDAISLVLAVLCLKLNIKRAPAKETLKELDWTGCFLIAAGAILFLLGLESGASHQHSWTSAYTLCMIIFGVFLLAAFMIWEWRFAKVPLIPIQVFASRTSRAALTIACCHSFVFIAFDFYLALYFQAVLGRSPIISGVLLFALILPLSLCTMATGMFIGKTGKVRPAIWSGCFFMTLGTGLFINFGSKLVIWKIILFQIIAGIGVGPLFQAPMIALQSVVKQRDVAAANSAFTFLRSLITSLSIVIGGVVLQRGLGSDSLTGNGHVSAGGGDNSKKYAAALSNMWIFYTAFCGVMLVSTFWVGKIDVSKKPTHNEQNDAVVEETVVAPKGAEALPNSGDMVEKKINV
ncbi:MFS general substrate transporter [Aureobasidium pullulans]|nr:MFS general substrate transporter [Aureobasidium pullulans]